jgi:ribosomal protein L13E
MQWFDKLTIKKAFKSVKNCKKMQKRLQNGAKMITFCTKVVKKLQKNYKNEHGFK